VDRVRRSRCDYGVACSGAAGGFCSPIPQVADSIRILAPVAVNRANAPGSVEIIIAVKPPDEDITDNPPVTCRMLLKLPIGGYATL
jgi:hypothetical protein